MVAVGGQGADGRIGELLPSQCGMAVGLMGTYGECGVEQQHALPGPALQIARLGYGGTEVLLYLLEDVLQGWREGYAVLDGEGESVSLARLMVRVLPYDDDLDLLERTQVEGIEDKPPRRVARARGILLTYGGGELQEIRLLKLSRQVFFPRRVYLYIHRHANIDGAKIQISGRRAKNKSGFVLYFTLFALPLQQPFQT